MNIIKQSCVLFLWMHTLTFVDSQPCTLEQFKRGKLYDENFDTSEMESQYDSGRQIRVPCNVGFSGFFKLICVQGGWQHRGTQCKAKSCGHPGDAQFADFNLAKGDDFVFGSQVVYTCHKGYQMVSRSDTRHCMADGWDGVVPVCEAQHCPVLHVDNNVHVNGDTEEAVYGNVVRFSCKSSAEIVEGPTEIYCNENGEWSDAVPKCKEIKCEAPVITHGSVHQPKNVYKENEYIDFSCEYGYKKTEERATKCTKVGNGAAFIPTPACELIRCKLDLPAPRGTTYNPASLSIFVPGDRVTVECGHKYYISDTRETSVVSVCKQDGRWSIIPTCKEVTCTNQRPENVYSWDVYWGDQFKLGDTVSYNCRSGYRRKDGATEATCTRNGWSPNPLCEELPCDRFNIKNTDIVNDKETYKQGESADYVCKNGYKGSFSLICSERGTWAGRQNCQEITCRRQTFDNAVIEGRRFTYHYNEQARYVCKNGRRFSLTCKEEGWTGHPQCDGCITPQVPNGFFVTYNKTVFYTCNKGYKLVTKGWWGKATCKDSLWSGLHKCIEEDKCGNLPVIPNGQTTVIQVRTYGEGDSVQITCNEEYTAEIDRLTCTGGKWNLDGEALKTVCIPTAQPCGPPFKVDNAVVKASYQKKYVSGSTVTYQCRHGYSTQDETTITCIDGNWEPSQITCESQRCPVLHVDNNVKVDGDTEEAVYGNVVRFSCNSSAEIVEGPTEIYCNENGEWSDVVPKCKEIKCEAPVITHGSVHQRKKGYKENEYIDFSCEYGYKKTEERATKCTKVGNGAAFIPTPACEPSSTVRIES